jgi:AcrR family transcriptional regulator
MRERALPPALDQRTNTAESGRITISSGGDSASGENLNLQSFRPPRKATASERQLAMRRRGVNHGQNRTPNGVVKKMRVRTETGRRKIVDAAIEIFRAEGYERASMDRIAARTGGSKATLYGYFPSKENLFAIAMGEAITQQGERALTLLDPLAPDVEATLLRFGEAFLRVTTSDDALAITRALIAEGAAQQELTAAIYQRGLKRFVDTVTAYLSDVTEQGRIRIDNPRAAATHLHGLLYAGTLLPQLFGAKPDLSRKVTVREAIRTFLAAHSV